MNRLLRLVIPLVALSLPTAICAQNAGEDTSITRGTKLDPNDPKPETGKDQPVFAYLIALVGSGVILFIVCSPSRKS